MLRTTNPEATALNQVRREAEEAGVLADYLAHFRVFPCDNDMGIAARRELIQKLEEEKNNART